MGKDLNSIERIRRMVAKYVAKGPYRLYPDQERVESGIEGLAKNLEKYGRAYCPCIPIEKCLEAGRKYVCPCEPHHEDIARQGYCDCALFVSEEFLRQCHPELVSGSKREDKTELLRGDSETSSE